MEPHAAPSTPSNGRAGSPAFLTVEEAAAVLRIGRTAAYLLARRWEDTGGAEGLPVVRFGRLLRAPVDELERLAGGAIEPTGEASAPSASTRQSGTEHEAAPKTPTERRPRRKAGHTQPTLFPDAS